MMTFRSDIKDPLLGEGCDTNEHERCDTANCACYCHVFKTTDLVLSIEECKILYNLLQHQYISYENKEAHEVLNKISKIVNQK